MASTDFTDKTTVILAEWLNDVDDVVYAFSVTKTGTTIDSIDLTATNINFNGTVTGNTAPTASNHLTRKDYTDGLHRITTRSVTASTSLVLADERNSVSINNASAVTLTIDPVSTTNYPIGFQFVIVQAGAGVITVTAGSGVTVKGLTKTSGSDDIISAYHESSNVWRVAGGVA